MNRLLSESISALAPWHARVNSRGRSRAVTAALLAAVLYAVLPGASAQLPVGGFLGSEPIEDIVEEAVEREIQAAVEQATEQNIQENIEDNIEETIEQTVDDAVVEVVEDVVESSVEEELQASLEDGVEAGVEDSVEAGVEESVARNVESSVEASVEHSVSDAVEEGVEDTVEVAVEDTVEGSVEEALEDSVETAVEDSVQESVASSVEDSVESSVEGAVGESVEDEVEQRVVAAVEERLDTEIDEIVDNLESDLEVNEDRILREQWLVMAEPMVFTELADRGYLFDTVTELPGLGLRLAEVAAPSSFDISEIRNGVIDVVGKDRAEVDLNHFYTAGVPEAATGEGLMPRTAMHFPADLDHLDVRVGMIDSRVDTTHPALTESRIEARSFARPGAEAPQFHGTAIASIIAGNALEYRGLAPNAQLYAASVFELDGERGEIASTVSLIRALDWLISSDVDVINVSLAGPPNRLLERALQRASVQDVVVMAAAGNGGPLARPMYPAAYESVVAITAVDAAQRVFRLANRGDYLALSAPGVDLRHAQPGGGYASSSGTSFAVPFAVTAAARLSRTLPGADIITMLLESALDIGPPGRDQIYGYGLLTMAGP